jgi:hypothetical protein
MRVLSRSAWTMSCSPATARPAPEEEGRAGLTPAEGAGAGGEVARGRKEIVPPLGAGAGTPRPYRQIPAMMILVVY